MSFFIWDWERRFFWGWGLIQRVVSWVAWKGKVWLFLKVGRWDFKKILRNNVLVLWDGVVGERGWVYFLL
jgi:hypothetical protein